jgi:hypothetical protein
MQAFKFNLLEALIAFNVINSGFLTRLEKRRDSE